MPQIVTLQQLKEHLRYDGNDEDEFLELTLEAAENVVLGYITKTFEEGNYPSAVQKAVLVLAGYFDNYRNAESEAPVNGNFLPMPVQALLYRYRSPTIGGV